jgi:hypothetical protein
MAILPLPYIPPALNGAQGGSRRSNPLKFLNKIVYLRLRPGVAVIPEIEQRVLVARHPLDDLRRQLADDTVRQAVGDDGRNIRNRNGEALG